jgi:hypothetical protein
LEKGRKQQAANSARVKKKNLAMLASLKALDAMCSKLNGRKRKEKDKKPKIDSLPRQDIITALVRSCMHDTPVGIRPI